jgi:hypothetical protein
MDDINPRAPAELRSLRRLTAGRIPDRIFRHAVRLRSRDTVLLPSNSRLNRPPQHQKVNNMKLTKNLGMLLLGIWLSVTGLLQGVSLTIPAIGTILALLAIAAGVSILLGR